MTTSALKGLGIRADVVIGPYKLRYTNLTDKSEFAGDGMHECIPYEAVRYNGISAKMQLGFDN